MTKKGKNDDFKDLRRKAERKLKRGKEPPQQITKEEALKTLHELHVHQIELPNGIRRDHEIEVAAAHRRRRIGHRTDDGGFASQGLLEGGDDRLHRGSKVGRDGDLRLIGGR